MSFSNKYGCLTTCKFEDTNHIGYCHPVGDCSICGEPLRDGRYYSLTDERDGQVAHTDCTTEKRKSHESNL